MKILFMIPNLCGGGAERVLVNLTDELVKKHDITILSLFDEGENRDKLNKNVKYKYIFKNKIPGLRLMLRLFSLKFIANIFLKDEYDIIVPFLEGLVTRIVSASKCSNKKIAWIHSKFSLDDINNVYKSIDEFKECYMNFDKIISVSNDVRDNFLKYIPELKKKCEVIHNVNNINKIKKMAIAPIDIHIDNRYINTVVIGKIEKSKGVNRLVEIYSKNKEKYSNLRIYFIGEGSEYDFIASKIKKDAMSENLFLLGYKSNPYNYLDRMDVLICPSFTEGLSTSVTEALILGKAVLTTNCGGMQELLGNRGEYGLIVENSSKGLEEGLNKLVDNTDIISYYCSKSLTRGKEFYTDKIIGKIESVFDEIK